LRTEHGSVTLVDKMEQQLLVTATVLGPPLGSGL
jgi:hypothetical protein